MKAKEETLLKEIADNFNQFLKQGKLLDLNLEPFYDKIDPNLKIDEIEKLLKIHFVLTKTNEVNEYGVIDFVEKLAERLRRIKTTIKKESNIFNGEVKGRINWKETMRLRYNQNPNNRTLFVCDKQEKNYEISENLVLKKLLREIFSILNKELKFIFEDKKKPKYKWLEDWVEKPELKKILEKIYLKNVYLKKINLKNVNVTKRMINRAKHSRSALYREAAFLLSKYNRLLNYQLNQEEIKELLKNTFIIPEKTEVLFELYWIIKIIKQLITPNNEPLFYLLKRGNEKNLVARWEYNNFKYKIYHNSTGNLDYEENIEKLIDELNVKDKYFGRKLKVEKKLIEMAKKRESWNRRPDIILEKYDKLDNLISIFIGEVKYTSYRTYAITGLKELLEYIALIKNQEKYYEPYDNLFKNLQNIKGALFLDTIDDLNIKDVKCIQIIMFNEEKTINIE